MSSGNGSEKERKRGNRKIDRAKESVKERVKESKLEWEI